jgi:hypothetical protein
LRLLDILQCADPALFVERGDDLPVEGETSHALEDPVVPRSMIHVNTNYDE